MSAILLSDQKLDRLATKVNAATGKIPAGGLVYANAIFYQLLVDGESGGVEYSVVESQDDIAFAAEVQAITGKALGAPIYVNGAFVQAFGAVDGGGDSVAWADITGKPATFAPIVGTTATTAKAGNYVPAWTEVTGKPAVIAAGADAAAARTAIGAGTPYTLPNAAAAVRGGVLQAPVQAASTATDVAGLLADFNALLTKLKTAGVMANA